MRDDFTSRDWADHHARLSAGITTALRHFWRAFERHHARDTAAPWRARSA